LGEQLITKVTKKEVAPYVFLCGEPERVPRIADALGGGREMRVVREYSIYKAELEGEEVTIASTGVGGASTAVLMEEMANVGAHTFLRVGTSGGIGAHVKKGDFVISTGAIREEGTSKAYAWPTYPAAAHYQAVLALVAGAASIGAHFHVGITFSVDGFYAENKILKEGELLSMSHNGFMLPSRQGRLGDVAAMGALHIEMENSTLFTLGGLFGLRTGSICTVSDVVPWHPTDEIINFEENIADCIQAAARGMEQLIRWDRERGEEPFWWPGMR
jgi:uridine phosphorylase